MSNRTIYLYDYVAVPYERVRALLASDAQPLITEALDAAGTRARTIATQLSVSIAGFEVGREISITLGPYSEAREGMASARLHISWEATDRPSLFPLMEADLEALPLTENETEVVLAGVYRPPFGTAGSVLNSGLLHRIAEASVRHFFEKIVQRISREIPPLHWW